jgi:hypothetical protein
MEDGDEFVIAESKEYSECGEDFVMEMVAEVDEVEIP